MFADGYLSLSFAELIGFAITIVSVWLVVRQLNATRLASQMEGMISLQAISNEMRSSMNTVRDFTDREEWKKFDYEEVFAVINGKDEYKEGYKSYARLYELMGALVKAGALDGRVAVEHFGWEAPEMYRRFEKYTRTLRKKMGTEEINENWEWLAMKFGKMNS